MLLVVPAVIVVQDLRLRCAARATTRADPTSGTCEARRPAGHGPAASAGGVRARRPGIRARGRGRHHSRPADLRSDRAARRGAAHRHGAVYATLPGPNVELDPQFILTFVIPPLIYSAALDSSLPAIRDVLRVVISLSVVLVLLTAVLVGVGFQLFVPGVGLAAGIALGAAVARPTRWPLSPSATGPACRPVWSR